LALAKPNNIPHLKPQKLSAKLKVEIQICTYIILTISDTSSRRHKYPDRNVKLPTTEKPTAENNILTETTNSQKNSAKPNKILVTMLPGYTTISRSGI
jgi:hypothetical protein